MMGYKFTVVSSSQSDWESGLSKCQRLGLPQSNLPSKSSVNQGTVF